MPGAAFGIVLITVVGQCVGAGDYESAKKQTAKVMKLSYLSLILVNIVILIFLEQLLGLFKLSPDTHSLAVTFLRIHCISMGLGWSMSFVLPNALRAAGDVRFVMIVAVISMWSVRVSAAYLLTFNAGIGPLGVWLAMGGDFFVRGTAYCLRWLSGKWKEKKVIG